MKLFDACSLPEELREAAEHQLILAELESQLKGRQREVFALLLEGQSKAAARKRLHLTPLQLEKIINHIRLLYIQAGGLTE